MDYKTIFQNPSHFFKWTFDIEKWGKANIETIASTLSARKGEILCTSNKPIIAEDYGNAVRKRSQRGR